VRASSARAACLLSAARARTRVFSVVADGACVHTCERSLHARAAASAVTAAALSPMQRVVRREDGARAGRASEHCVAMQDCTHQPRAAAALAHIGTRRGRRGAIRQQLCVQRDAHHAAGLI
jgi:hypothetical protein